MLANIENFIVGHSATVFESLKKIDSNRKGYWRLLW